MKKYSQILKIQHLSKGFTLVELLLAMSLSLVVLTLAGSGLVSIMNANQKAETESEKRFNLNRALDYIADEVRGAKNVSSVSGGSTLPSSPNVLLITIPAIAPATTPTYKVYYSSPTTNNWAPPYSINVGDNTASTSVNLSSSNQLVDGVANVFKDTSCTSNYKITVTNGTNSYSACIPQSSAPVCGVSAVGNNGFYACIGSDYRTVDLYLYGQVSDTNPNKFAMATTKVFARSN